MSVIAEAGTAIDQAIKEINALRAACRKALEALREVDDIYIDGEDDMDIAVQVHDAIAALEERL